jgi:hypothetical protein
MTMIDIKDKMQLWGKISISQNGGQEILTRDLTIDQYNNAFERLIDQSLNHGLIFLARHSD